MAQFSIEQANIGYDKVGIQSFLEKINVDVIDELVQEINKNTPNLQSHVDQMWVGQAADAFKGKIERDSITMVQTLDKIKLALTTEFGQIIRNVDNYDEAIADSLLK